MIDLSAEEEQKNQEENQKENQIEKTEDSKKDGIETESVKKKDSEKKEPEKEKVVLPETQENPKKAGKVVGRVFAILGVAVGMVLVGLLVIMFIMTHGPSSQVRDLFVLSVRESSAGGFLADIYCSKETIAEIEAKNTIVETEEVTDTSIVTIAAKEEVTPAEGNEPSYIVTTSFDTDVYVENGIEFHKIAGNTFTGLMMIVADPSRVFIGTPYDSYDGGPGLDVPTIAGRYDAIAAINGAFFVDTNGVGDGGTPLGFVFSEGKQMWGGDNTTYNMMGFNEEGILICGKMTGSQAVEKGIRDGLSPEPFLVINGEGLNVAGSGGGLNPRTALGQRADGAVLLLTVDGRQASSLGATMSDMVDVMLAFGAVNAGNLDGGGSTVCYYNKEVLNVVMSIYGTRGVPDAVCVRKVQ